jgi:hypothetical protein
MLTRPVPPARRPVAKPQASWQQLKVGQRLSNKEPITRNVRTYHVGSLWEVTYVDSLGAKIRLVQCDDTFTVTDPNWKLLFERVRAPSKRKTKVPSGN